MKSKAKDPIEHGEELADYLSKRWDKLGRETIQVQGGGSQEFLAICNVLNLAWECEYWRAVALKADLPGI